MSERIVSPGVFTRERDLSFLPVGIGEIGAAIVGPTVKGPSFVPTVINSFADFEATFGSYTTDYYTPYTVKEYLRAAGSVTVVRVGHLGGYKSNTFNLVVSASVDGNVVMATFAHANPNVGGSISGSLDAMSAARETTITLNGANATASVAGITAVTDNLHEKIGSEPRQPKIGNTSAPVYMYKHFRSSINALRTNERIKVDSTSGEPNATLSIENVANGLNFQAGTTSVNDTTYVTTITGNKDTSTARTPIVQSFGTAGQTDLFRIYTRVDGDASNNYYAVISEVKQPANNNVSSDFAQFSLALYDLGGNQIGPSYNRLCLDPDNANYLIKIIGDQFQTVDAQGEVTTHGNYPNQNQWIRIGDYDEDTFRGTPALMPGGFDKVLDPVSATATVPTGSFVFKQAYHTDTATYKEDVPYGWRMGTNTMHGDDNLYTNIEYHSPIPSNADNGSNAVFNLANMYGFGTDNTVAPGVNYTNFALETGLLAKSSSIAQMKFAVPFQHGFNGVDPAVKSFTGGDITAANLQGFDCSTSTASGSVSYKRAISAIGNPDEIDINMLVTPGVIHSLHSSITNHAIDTIESRADAFYIMDGSQWGDSVATAVSNVSTLDTNYVGTYYPWVKIDDPSTGTGVWVPPSVVIPGVIAFTDRVSHEWFAPAGLNRGGLSSVRMTKKKLTHTDRDTLYEARINPIASFPGQGVVVFGQKTLQAKPSALDRINVRRLLIRLKKFIASSSRYLLFEQNDSSTRARFLNIVNPFLESVQSNSGLSAFRVVMDDSNNTPDVIDRNQLVGQIFIQPTRTAEFIVLDFSVLPTGAAFPE